MKYTRFYSLLLLILLSLPVAAKAQTTPPPSQPAEVTEDTIDLQALKNQPVSVRRKIVAGELGDILLRLNVLYDKTKAATDRLAENGISTEEPQANLTAALLSLTEAKRTTDLLIEAANNPAHEHALILIVDGRLFKEEVVKTEDSLRSARASIIQALTSLKAAVSAATALEE